MIWNRLGSAAALSLALTGTTTLAVLALGASPRPQAPPPAHREAVPIARPAESSAEILALMARTYAEARSYEDEGLVTTVFFTGKTRRTVKKPFATRFSRPGLFYYEFSERFGDGDDESNRYVIWSDQAPQKAKRWWTIQPEVLDEPLSQAIGSAQGVSGGSSTTIPQMMLLAASPSLALTGFKDPRPAVEEEVDKVPCLKIDGKSIVGNPLTVWIDRETHLLRKIFTTSKVPGSDVETTTTYFPRLNPDIPPQRFTFDPPKP